MLEVRSSREMNKFVEVSKAFLLLMGKWLEFGERSRYAVLAIGMMSLSTTLSCVICFNVAFIRITNLNDTLNHPENATLSLADQRFQFSTSQKSLLFSSTFFSPVTLFWVVAWLMRSLGTYKTQLICGITTSIFTALTPFVIAYLPFWALFLSRFIQGIPLCNLYPVVGAIVNQWSCANEKGMFISVLTGYLQISAMLGMALGGILSEFVSWPAVFYVHSALNLFLFFLWAIYYRDDPHNHPFISRKELLKIEQSRASTVINSRPKSVPYCEIFQTKSVIAIYVAVLGNFVAFNFVNTFFAQYLHKMFGIKTLEAGLITAAVLLGQFVVKFVTGVVCDRLVGITELSKIRWCNSIAFLGTATLFVVYLSIPITWPVPSIIFLALPYIILGVNAGGFPKSAVLISGQHTQTILAFLQVFLCGSFLIGSVLVPAMTPSSTYLEFTNVFRLYVVLLILTNGFFVAFSRATPEKWARPAVPEKADLNQNEKQTLAQEA